MLQRNLAKQKKITDDRPVETGDHILIDYEGMRDGKPFEAAAKTVNFAMKVGDAQILESFDQQIVGMRVGEDRSLRVVFPQDYRNPELAGLEIDFDVSLKEIREEELPPIDDEMAKQLGTYESLEALRTAISENLQSGYEKRIEQELNEQVFAALIAKTDFELPDSLVDFELEGILTDIERRLTMQNLRMEDVGMTREGLMEKYRPTAEKQVRRHLILNKIVEQESMTLSDEQLEKGFQDLAENYNQPVEGIKSYYRQNREKEDLFRHTLLEKQAIELIIDHSQVEEVDPEPPAAESEEATGET
jgi:trigger factor